MSDEAYLHPSSPFFLLQEEEEYIRKAAAKGLVLNHTDDLFIPHKNRLEEDELEGTGLDAAVDLLSEAVSGKASVDEHPERRRKVHISFFVFCFLLLALNMS